MDWGLVGSALFGGAAGMGEAGLEQIKQEREVARQEGIIRLQAEMNMEISNNNFSNQKTLADETWEKTRTAAGEDYIRDRQNAIDDREDAQAFQLGLLGEAAKYKGGPGTPARIQELEWYKANNIPISGSGGGGSGLRASDRVALIKAYTDAKNNGDTSLSFNEWAAEMGIPLDEGPTNGDGGNKAVSPPIDDPNDYTLRTVAGRKKLTDAATAKTTTVPKGTVRAHSTGTPVPQEAASTFEFEKNKANFKPASGH